MEPLTILTVTNKDLDRLKPEAAVDLLRELLWAEASEIGIATHLVNVPSAITVADGGIDAEISNDSIGGQGIIKEGLTRYQIKTGDFPITQQSKIKELLFDKKGTVIKPRVKACLDRSGTFVIVLFGWDGPEKEDGQIREMFIKELVSVNSSYKDAKIEVWGQNILRGFLRGYPSLALKVNGRTRARFSTHEQWAMWDDMRVDFKAGKEHEETLQSLRTELRRNDTPVHVRVLGEPGIGKTRLVLEATDVDDLRPLIVYISPASEFLYSDLMNELQHDEFSTILVIDECTPEYRASIWNRLRAHSPRLKIISIFNEEEDTTGITYLRMPPLPDTEISKVIQDYAVPKERANQWAAECGGSPRVAHVVGQNLELNPEDILKSPSTVNIWDRYIVGLDDPLSTEVQQRRLVLQYLALFKKVGYGRELVEEAKAVANLIQQADLNITWVRFQKIIKGLRARRILQGEHTLYISPRLFHVKLWLDWWDTYGEGIDLEDFSALPGALPDWFFEMFKYASGSEAASRTAKELLSQRGPFQQNQEVLRSSSGARFFRVLSEVEPVAALQCLVRTIGTWPKEELIEFVSGRREVVWSLERLAQWGQLFNDAARLLLKLGEAENERWSNNASGVFADLFFVNWYRELAFTEAAPEERFRILQEALESDSPKRRQLALRACDRALETNQLGAVNTDRQLFGQRPKLWSPQTYEEAFDAYRRVWLYLVGRLDYLPSDEQLTAVNILLDNVRGLGQFESLSEMVLSTIEELVQRPYVEKRRIIELVVRVLRYDKNRLNEENQERWQSLLGRLHGDSFESQLRRFVGMSILEDSYDMEGNKIDYGQRKLEELAILALEQPSLLHDQLNWLVSAEAENGYRLGYELGIRDTEFSQLDAISSAQTEVKDNPSLLFLSGYLRALFELEIETWEVLLDSYSVLDEKRGWVPEITWRSGAVTDRAAERVLRLLDQGAVSISQLQMFSYGQTLRNLSEVQFQDWCRRLLETSDPAAAYLVLELVAHRYVINDAEQPLPRALTYSLLSDSSFFRKRSDIRPNQMVAHYWEMVGRAFVSHYSEDVANLVDVWLENFDELSLVLPAINSRQPSLLTEITQQFPQEVWRKITGYLMPPITSQGWFLRNWLRGDNAFDGVYVGAIAAIPHELIWGWIKEDDEERAWFMALLVPPLLIPEEEGSSLARELLVRYGDRERVRNELMANFSTEGWTGEASLHFEKKREALQVLLQQESNINVRRWIEEYSTYLAESTERARMDEERRR